MKKIVYSLLAASLLAGLTACSDDDKTVPSSVFDQGSVTSVAKPGEVVFHWTKPSDPDYYYVKVKYDDPQKGVVVKDASAYADSIVIDGLYAKYGALNYQFSFVSRDGGETAPFTVSAQAGAVEPTVKDAGLGDAIALTGADLWTDDQEELGRPAQGPRGRKREHLLPHELVKPIAISPLHRCRLEERGLRRDVLLHLP